MTTMTPRQRVWRAIRHEEPDCVPWHLGCTAPMRRKLEAHYGASQLDDVLGNHLAKYRPRAPDALEEIRPGHFRDEFGVVWNRTVDPDIGVVENHVLKDRSLAGCRFPDPHDPARFRALPGFIAEHANRFRYVSVSFSLFERAWALRGMTELMVDMLEAPAFVDELLDALVAFDLGLVEEAVKYDIDGILFGDDWGHQTGLLFGARLWRRFIKPRLAILFGAVKRAGKAVMIHSCGKVQELFPDLIELGLDVFNPFQPEVMDLIDVKRRYGDRLAFFGGMSIQRVLPFGTPHEVREEAQRLAAELGRGGGFILAPAHDMPSDIPVENVAALVEAMQAQ